ncbi:ABC transporter family substrate-binding protein [Cryobacterium psychrophilum]|uniref:ABC transporter family substrate-binding protein n=1 Tax=Cryobacterium psychrophilum TaxID=41988 RepID=A0A4Y8KLY7_9MICO|nr:ABC transporter family substrate-binding protein [Cryobacterium psychrophilum]TDW30893.1 peptide/nickel transport system substrate-binding protein [Cryobacterium psychrophilum]TFD75720.1 ABC transporter family substrate-binding protein [Cryobacterium psychrophilum]
MSTRSAVVWVVAICLLLSGCTASTAESGLDKGATVTVASAAAFDSYNPATTYGNSAANSSVAVLTNDWFTSVDDAPKLVRNEQFGTSEMVSKDPLTVKYTVNPGVTWSDGTSVDAADLLLDWVANSRALDTPGFVPTEVADPQTHEITADLPPDTVYFDSGAKPDTGLGLVHDLPTLSDDNRAITMVYAAPYADWQLVFPRALPAHVVGKNALDLRDNAKAKSAVTAAISSDDKGALSRLASFWNSGFNFTALPDDPELLISTGPYTISDLRAGESVTLTANPEYTGSRKPSIETVVLRHIADPLAAVQALGAGDVDVISTPATGPVRRALANLDEVTSATGSAGTYEHIDLQAAQSKSGVFADVRVRRAFMKVVPRKQILDELVAPIAGERAALRDSQVFLPGTSDYSQSVKRNGSDAYADVDVPGARALLSQAGVTDPSVCILYESSNPRRVQEFQLIADSAARAGFSVADCGDADWRELLGASNTYDAALYGWSTPSLAVSGPNAAFATSGVNNHSFISNAEIDAVTARLATELDAKVQVELRERLDRLLWDNAYSMPLFDLPTVTAHSTRIAGVAPSILAPHLAWNLPEWTVVR